MKSATALVAAIGILLMACSDHSEEASAVELHAANSPLTFKQEALSDNLRSTDATLLPKVNRISVAPHANEPELRVIRYQADVSTGTDASITGNVEILAYTDDDVSRDVPAERWFVSVCKDADGTLYLPDVGFIIPFDTKLMATYQQQVAAGSEKNTMSACESN